MHTRDKEVFKIRFAMSSYYPTATINCANKCWFCVSGCFRFFKLQNIDNWRRLFFVGKPGDSINHLNCHSRSGFPVSVITDDLYFKVSWRISTSLKAWQFSRLQWDSESECPRTIIMPTTYSSFYHECHYQMTNMMTPRKWNQMALQKDSIMCNKKYIISEFINQSDSHCDVVACRDCVPEKLLSLLAQLYHVGLETEHKYCYYHCIIITSIIWAILGYDLMYSELMTKRSVFAVSSNLILLYGINPHARYTQISFWLQTGNHWYTCKAEDIPRSCIWKEVHRKSL